MKTQQTLSSLQILCLTICLLLFIPLGGKSQAQVVSVAEAIERAEKAGIDKQQLERIRNLASENTSGAEIAKMIIPAAELAERGLPTEFLMQKMMEGFAKGVPSNRMMPLLELIYTHTPGAVALSEQWVENPDVKPFIDALGDGASRFKRYLTQANLKSLTRQIEAEQIEIVLNELGRPSVLEKTSPVVVAAAVGVLPDMPESVRKGNDIPSVIAKAVEGGFSASDIQKLPVAVNAAERRSQLPAASILNRMSDQIGHGIPANQVLQNLFNGNLNPGPPSGIPGRGNGKPNGNPGRGKGNSGGF